MSKKSDTVAIVTVHGTGDTAEGPDGQKWFQRGSGFTERLKRDLAAGGVDAEIVPVLWIGANSASDREAGADKLTRELKRIRHQYKSVHVIGHSHGGNVANDAAVNLRWGMRRKGREPFDSLITVGTPFLNVRTGMMQRIAGLAFLALTWASIIAFPILAIVGWVQAQASHDYTQLLIFLAVVGGCLFVMFRISTRGARRILRPNKPRNTTRSVLAIWHENDEAISFLRRVEEFPIEAFPRGALFRGSRAAAISWGVLAVLIVALAFPVMYMAGVADIFGIDDTPSAGRAADVFASTFLGLLVAPAVFVGVYLLYRFVIGGMVEYGGRQPINNWVSGVLRGVAMGRDGDQVICQASTASHTHQTASVRLDGDVAQRMQSAAQGAADKLIDKYRWSLFTVGGDTNAPLSQLATDAMTWNSLIHTTYFDQPEVADVIAAHILALEKGEVHRPAFATAAPAPFVAPPDPDPTPLAPGGEVPQSA